MARKGTEALSSEGANNGNIEYLFGNNKCNVGGMIYYSRACGLAQRANSITSH